MAHELAPQELATSKYIVTELHMPESKKRIHEQYVKYATRVLWLDQDVVEGAFHMNVSWYLKAGPTREDKPHVHQEGEIIGFFGCNPEDPYDLGGEVEIWLENDMHVLDRSALIYVPPGMRHCPLIIRRLERPIFHFTVVNGPYYDKSEEGVEREA